MKRILGLIGLILLFACGEPAKETEETTAPKKERYSKDGPHKEYYENGKLKIAGRIKKGQRHDKWTFYYPNGFKWSEGFYKYGVRKGPATIYYDDGKVNVMGEYRNDEKVGVWKVWDKDGSLLHEYDLDAHPELADSLQF